jgi:hypothetical protein
MRHEGIQMKGTTWRAALLAAMFCTILATGESGAQAPAQGAPAAGDSAARPRMTPEQREEARRRWEAMSPEERRKAAEDRRARRADELARMTPEQRERLEARRQAARERWAKMTPEERQALRQRAAERRAQPGSGEARRAVTAN